MGRQWFKLKLTILLIYTSIYIICPAHAQKFEFERKKKSESISFTEIKNLVVIPVYVNNKGPYNFLLDTGVGHMIITDTTFLAGLNLSQYQTVKVQGYGLGEGIEAIVTRDMNASVGIARIKNIPTAIFKSDVFDLSAYLGMKIHGILGYYFFNSFVVKINYGTNRLTYYDPGLKKKRKGLMIPIRMSNGKPYITAEVELSSLPNTQIELLVDNGSSHPLMLESLNSLPFPVPQINIPANLGVGINGEIKGVMGRINTLKIKDLEFGQVLTGFPEYNKDRATIEGKSRNGSLGAELLKNFLVTFDYQNRAMYLKKRNHIRYKFEHDMSGMEIYVHQEKTDRFYVGRIEPGSPSEDAGILAGDEILSVNFKNMNQYTLDGLTELLRERDGQQMLIEVQRRNERVITVIRLKKRI